LIFTANWQKSYSETDWALPYKISDVVAEEPKVVRKRHPEIGVERASGPQRKASSPPPLAV